MILVVVLSLRCGYNLGGVYGLVVGLLMDLVGGEVLGANALAKTMIGTGLGSLKSFVFQENIILKISLVFGASVVHDLLIYLVQIIMNQKVAANSLHMIILPAALYNMAIAALFISFFHWLRKR